MFVLKFSLDNSSFLFYATVQQTWLSSPRDDHKINRLRFAAFFNASSLQSYSMAKTLESRLLGAPNPTICVNNKCVRVVTSFQFFLTSTR
jgi:hypothetical protein